MSIDDRIRAGLAASAELTTPSSVEEQLGEVRRRYRIRRRVRIAVVAAVVLVLGVALPVVALGVIDARRSSPEPVHEPSLEGTYRVEVTTTSGAPAAVAGAWTITFEEGGRIAAVPPERYRGSPPGAGETYTVDGSRLTTNLLVGSPGCQRTNPPVGAYRVEVTASGLSFEVVSDSCPARLALFGSPWRRTP